MTGLAWDRVTRSHRPVGSRRWVAETGTIPKGLREFDPDLVSVVRSEHRSRAEAVRAAHSRPDDVGAPRVRQEEFRRREEDRLLGEWLPLCEWEEV